MSKSFRIEFSFGEGYSRDARMSESIVIPNDVIGEEFWEGDARKDFRAIIDGYIELLKVREQNRKNAASA